MEALKAKQLVAEAGKRLLSEGLTARTWGNISCRIDDELMAITPSGLGYDGMSADDIVIMNINTGEWEGKYKPSSEKRIHSAAYQHFPDIGFVIHTHQTYASAIGLAGFDELVITDQEIYQMGGIARSDYALPSTKELFKKVSMAFDNEAHVVLMANHGAVILGENSNNAFNRAILLEDICQKNVKGQPKNLTFFTEKHTNVITTKVKEEFTFVEITNFPAVLTCASTGKPVRAQLDDMAQMIGPKLRVVPAEENKIINSLHKTNVILVPEIGAFCRAESDQDVDALSMLVKKACISWLHVKALGCKRTLSIVDSILMRIIYSAKYSKKIGGSNEKTQHKELWRTIKFVLFSISAGVIQIGSFTLLYNVFSLTYWVSYLAALVLSVLWNFTLNRRFTFQSAANVPVAMLKLFGYYCVFTPITTIGGTYLEGTIGWNGTVVTLINMGLNLTTEYLYNKFVIYKNSMDTNDVALKNS